MGSVAVFALQALPLLAQLAAKGIDIVTQLQAANAVILKAQAENRDPTPDEWATIDALSAEVHAAVQNG